jgi:hypothetical protein
VAVGGQATVVTSSNGRDWVLRFTLAPTSFLNDFHAVAYGNGVFVATGPQAGIATSSDLSNWAFQSAQCNGIGTAAYADGLFLATGSYFIVNGNEWIWTGGMLASTDGTNWVRQSPADGHIIRSLAFGNGLLVGVEDAANWGGFQVSTNGTNWIALSTTSPDILNGVAFGSGHFVAVGRNGAILSSSDGFHWTSQRLGTTASIYGGVFSEEQFVLASDIPNSILKSRDGIVWEGQNLGASLRSITYGMGLYVAVGTGGIICTSTNANIWDTKTSPTSYDITKVVFGNGVFVALAAGGSILRSTNTIDWESRYLGCCVYCLGYGNGQFLIGGGGLGYTSLSTSTDGIQWIERLGGTTNSQSGTANEIACGNGKFLVRADSLLYSDNGTNWSRAALGSSVFGISFGYGVFIGIQDGYVATSNNGLNGAKRDAILSGVGGFLYGNGTFLGIGSGGCISQSDDVNRILGIRQLSGNQLFEVTLDGLQQFDYTLQSSTNLQIWSDLTTFTNFQSKVFLQTTNSPLSTTRFYRALRR